MDRALVVAAIATGFVVALVWLAVRANGRFRHESQLPMQWWLNGEVTWSAPRIFALSLVPSLAALVLGFEVITAVTLKPRAGQDLYEIPAALFVGVMFLAAQYFYFWMVDRTLKRKGE